MGDRYEALKDYTGLVGLGMIFATGLVTIITWLVAWWNGITTGSFRVVVNINAFGEMMAEFWLIWIVLILAIWGLYWYVHEAILERRERLDEFKAESDAISFGAFGAEEAAPAEEELESEDMFWDKDPKEP